MTADVEEVVKEEPQLALSSSDMTGEAVGKLLAFHTVLAILQTYVRCLPPLILDKKCDSKQKLS